AAAFPDHFSAVAAEYAGARPDYPPALYDWIAAIAPAERLLWEAGCGSAQATRGLARRGVRVPAPEPSAAQNAQARLAGPDKPATVDFAVEPGERCSLPDASADAACVAQALHWFDRPAFFAECARVLKPGGVLVAWGYQDIVMPDPALAAANEALQQAILPYWPPQRALIDAAYAGFEWPFPAIRAPEFELRARWTLPRLLGYYASYSATQRFRAGEGTDPVAAHAPAIAAAWGDPGLEREVRWPLFVHARRKPC
ncbi:MAG: methyltransferase domain-containing protein, partial [Luteimonas sp.]